MTKFKDKIQDTLDESRMLVLGAEILVGFEFTATFQDGFRKLSSVSQNLNLAALILMLFTLVLLLSPAAFHQLTERGEDTVQVDRYATHVMEFALLPFALGLGANAYIPAEEINGTVTGVIFGLGMALLAFLFWYNPGMLRRAHGQHRKGNSMNSAEREPASGSTPAHDKIRHVLTEARVIIPGNQALLGFQFAVILQQGFRELPQWLKWIHLASLSLIAVSTILLLTPAAYHRIVEHGEETEGFYQVASLLVLYALPPLAAGICGDFFLVVYKMTNQRGISLIAAGLMLSLFGGLWFGYTWFRRSHPRHLAGRPA